MTVIAFDYDDVLYPWYDNAHSWCIKHGLVPPGTPRPKSRAPHEEYKIEAEEWYAALDAATEEGDHLYLGEPIPGAVAALERAVAYGLDPVIITARGQFSNGERIRQLTVENVEEHFGHVIAPARVFFAKDKGPLARALNVEHAIDDSMPNIQSLWSYYVNPFLQTQTWNEHEFWPNRVSHVSVFVDYVIGCEAGR